MNIIKKNLKLIKFVKEFRNSMKTSPELWIYNKNKREIVYNVSNNCQYYTKIVNLNDRYVDNNGEILQYNSMYHIIILDTILKYSML